MKVLAVVAASVDVASNTTERLVMQAPLGTHIPKQDCTLERERINSFLRRVHEKSVN